MDTGAWWATVQSQRESDMTERVKIAHMALDSETETSDLLINM